MLNGATTTVKVAHVRLCHSRMLFVRAYPRETQEMVFDAHDRAFALFKGACVRGIYDNMKTAVDTIFAGQDRLYRTEAIKQILIPRATPTVSGANFEVLVGFEVTPEMAAFNRDGKRFRPNVGAAVASQDTAQRR